MAQQKQKRPLENTRSHVATMRSRGRETMTETDGVYFLKLIIVVLLGTFWIKFAQPITWIGIPIGAVPVGLFVGLLLVTRFEKNQSDRKIWYAILIVVTIICDLVPAGIVI